jgi:hypothetical protein
MAQKIVPNQYELAGVGVQVTYSTSSLPGKPQLTFTKGRKTLNFTGNEIGVVDTVVGTLVTVTIASTPDLNSTTFSFLVPSIELAKESAKQSFRTIGITTISKTPIGPVKGVQQTYKIVELRCTAQHVVS